LGINNNLKLAVMKKIFFSLLAAGLFLSIFVGCGKDPESDNPPEIAKPEISYNVAEVVANDLKTITLSWESFNATSFALNGNSVALKTQKSLKFRRT
jgi:hypothetical protein